MDNIWMIFHYYVNNIIRNSEFIPSSNHDTNHPWPNGSTDPPGLLRVVSRWAAGAAERRHCQDQPGAPRKDAAELLLRMVKIQPGGCKKTQATSKNRWLSDRIDLELLKSHDMTTSQKRFFREFMVVGKWKAIVVCLSDLCLLRCDCYTFPQLSMEGQKPHLDNPVVEQVLTVYHDLP